MQKADLNESAIDGKLVSYTVGGCWMIFALMYLPGKNICLFLNPLPLLLKAVVGILVYGYVGGTGGWELETVFVYWTLVGLFLSWCFHKTDRWGTIITIAAMAQLVLSALAFFPAMLLAGR